MAFLFYVCVSNCKWELNCDCRTEETLDDTPVGLVNRIGIEKMSVQKVLCCFVALSLVAEIATSYHART